jgi:small subunit ribosomal protein S18
MSQKRYKKFSEKNRCRFCRSRVEVNYKDVGTLQKLCTPQGKLFSRKRSGNCAKHQRKLKTAVKHARFLALMPYVG